MLKQLSCCYKSCRTPTSYQQTAQIYQTSALLLHCPALLPCRNQSAYRAAWLLQNKHRLRRLFVRVLSILYFFTNSCAIFLSAGSRTPNSGLHSGIRLLEKLPYCASAIKSRRVLISCVIVSSFFQLLHHHIIFICIFIWKFHIKCTKMLL